MSAIPSTIVRELKPKSDAAVALCADSMFFPLAFVVASRLARLSNGAYDVHILTETNPYVDRVPKDCPIGIELPIVLDQLPNQIKFDRFRSICALRLFVPEILSSRYRRILYVDSDVRVEEGVSELFWLDIEGAPIAAVDDYTLPFLPSPKADKNDRIRQRRELIGHSATDPYFNAGVILIDAETWRSNQTTNAALTLLSQLEKLHVNDQEMLNVLFRGQWAALSPRWNFTFFHDLGFESLLRPVLFHYAGAKPWELRWDRDPSHLPALNLQFIDTPFADYRHPGPIRADYVDGFFRALKWSLRQRNFNLNPAEIARRIRDAQSPQMRANFASYLIDNIRARRFLDVRAGITVLDADKVWRALDD
jgi:lipopolysaccharide biosynthesis glycosyltransferase